MHPNDRAAIIGLVLGMYQPTGNWELPIGIGFDETHQCGPEVEVVLGLCEGMNHAQIQALIRTISVHGWVRRQWDRQEDEPLFDEENDSEEAMATRALASKIQTTKAILLVILLLSSNSDGKPVTTAAIRTKLGNFGIKPSSLTATLSSLKTRAKPAILGEGVEGSNLGFELTSAGRDEIKTFLQKNKSKR